MMLYASLLCPCDCALWLTAAWRAVQKLYRDENTAPSLLFAVRVMRGVPAALGSGFRSECPMDLDLYHMR